MIEFLKLNAVAVDNEEQLPKSRKLLSIFEVAIYYQNHTFSYCVCLQCWDRKGIGHSMRLKVIEKLWLQQCE